MVEYLGDVDIPGIQGFEAKPSIKLIKNTKGYSWEIRITSLDIDEITKLNEKMRERFGGEI